MEVPVGSKSLHLRAIVAPTFGEDLKLVAQLTQKGNKVLFTKQPCLFLGPSANIDQGIIIGEKGSDNLYMLMSTLTKPKGLHVLNAQLGLPKENSE